MSNFLVLGHASSGPAVAGTQPCNIITLGDSLTVGFPGVPPDSYPGQMAERLATPVTNLGVDGARTDGVIALQVPAAIALYDPFRLNIIALMIGRNDLAGSVPLATVKGNIVSIISSLHATGFEVVLSTITPSGEPGQPVGFQADRVALNTWILAGGSGADLVSNAGNDPILADLIVSPYSSFSLTYYDPADLVHLTKAGYAVLAINIAACVLNLAGPPAPLPIDPFGNVLAGSFARDLNYKYYVDAYEYGFLSTASADINTQALQRAIATAQPLGMPVMLPEKSYNIHKTNLLQFNGLQQYPITLFSRAANVNGGALGTRLVCDGGGPSWLKGALNIVAPNSGNTAADWTLPLSGIKIQGICLDQTSGGTGISGIWLGNASNFVIEDCTAVLVSGGGGWRAGIELWTCKNGVIRSPRVTNAASGLALNGGVGDTMPGVSSGILVENPYCTTCSSAGISFQFSQNCRVNGGTLNNCAVGAYGSGPDNTLWGTQFTNNTQDVNMIQATAPYGGVVSPNSMSFFACSFGANVTVQNSAGSTICACDWRSGSSLTIASTATVTQLLQTNSFPSSFTDAGVATYVSSVLIGTANPIGATPGITGQIIFDKAHGVAYMCTVSGMVGTAVWTVWPGGSGSGVSSLNTLTGVLSITAGTGISVSAAGASVQVTNTAPATTPGAWAPFSTSITDGGHAATITINSQDCAYQQNGKRVYYRMYASVTISGANAINLQWTLPVNARFAGTDNQGQPGNILSGSTPLGTFTIITDTSHVGIAIIGGVSFANGGTYLVWIGTGVYEAA